MSLILQTCVACVVVTAVWLLASGRRSARNRKQLLARVPYVDLEGDNKSPTRYVAETGALIAKGYNQYAKKNLPFSIPNLADFTSPIVVLPLKYLDEVAQASQSQLSLKEYFDKFGLLKYTLGPPIAEAVQHVARTNLNRALNDLAGPLQKECATSFTKEMSPCPDWTVLQPYNILMKIFVRMGALVLVGPELQEEWVLLSFKYLPAFSKATRKVGTGYSAWTRWLAKYTDPDVKTVIGLRREAGFILTPVIKERLANKDSTSVKHNDAIQWLLEEYEARDRAAGRSPRLDSIPDELAQNLLVMTISSTHQTTMIALWLLFDLIEHPESLAEVRDEISRTGQGLVDGVWTRKALGDLRIMDSFMTETMRFHSFTQTTVNRMVMKPYTFRDGLLQLPEGTQISFPTEQYSNDPDVHPDPQRFDAKRHLRKRETTNADGNNSSKYHFASTADSLAWGRGPHACPGRFLVQDALKLIFIQLLTEYEFRYPPSASGEGVQRPRPDMASGINTMPDVTASIMFKEKELK